jgi:hypothetical protein
VLAPKSCDFRLGKSYSICGENSVQRRFGTAAIVRCRTSIHFKSTPWSNLDGNPWFGTTLATYRETRDRAADLRTRKGGNRWRIFHEKMYNARNDPIRLS